MPQSRGKSEAHLRDRTSRYPLWLLGILIVWWAGWAIGVRNPTIWWLENLLTLVAVVVLILTRRAFPLSKISYTCIFLHLMMHVIGAHYTYSEVPYRQGFNAIVGTEFVQPTGEGHHNLYDRWMHFLFGLLWAYPIRELFVRLVGVRGFWGYYLPLDVTISFSALYELMEWAVAIPFGGAPDFVGSQGDPWDAQKDMALATLGAVVAMCVVAFVNWKYDRHFGEEMRRSFEVKRKKPLGEVKLEELKHDK